MATVAIAGALAQGGCAGPPPRPPAPVWHSVSTYDAPRGNALLRQAMLASHAAARAVVREPPLVWDEALAADAMVHARGLAATNRFGHASNLAQLHEGENLFAGTRGAYSYADMAAYWVAEKSHYRPGTMPDISNTGSWHDVGHYSQIIWRATTRLGCAVASSAFEDYLVCRYSPPGNMIGERAN